MPTIEDDVASHYTTGKLTDRIMRALRDLKIDPDALSATDLKAGDEFHTGGVAATDHLFDQLEVTEDTRALDVGSGIGGTARYVAERFGAHVTGIDLTPEFVETATALSTRVGLGDKCNFHVGSALAMPVEDAGFDLAYLMHVGMNIADKTTLFAEVTRALKPGGVFALFEVMRGADPSPLDYPLPWSTVPQTSFVDTPETYKAAATAAGLELKTETDRTQFALDFFAEVFAKTAKSGPPALGIHLMMGDTAPEKFQNYVANLNAGRICPTEMVFVKP